MLQTYNRLENFFIYLLGVQAVATITILYLSFNNIYLKLDLSIAFIKIFIMIQIFVVVVFGNYYFNHKMKIAGQETDKVRKHKIYYTAYSTRLALLTLCNLLNAAAFIITSNEIYAIVILPLLVLFFIYKPDKKIFEDQSAAAS